MKAVIHFDGGCSPNPGQKYGSYSIELDGLFEIKRIRLPLGYGTNNEAEFNSLGAALCELDASCVRAKVSVSTISVQIFTDSTIVRNWIRNFDRFKPAKCKNERRLAMSVLAGNCLLYLRSYESFTIEWNSREVNVEKFGH